MANKINDYPVISTQDVINTIEDWKNKNDEKTIDIILDFASELTGLSIDTLLENIKTT